jgi:hypothetical protein
MLPDLSDEEQKAFYCMAKDELQQRGFTVRGKITSGVLSLIIFSNIPRTNEMDRVLRLYSDEGLGETPKKSSSVPNSPDSKSPVHDVTKKRVRSSSIPTSSQNKTVLLPKTTKTDTPVTPVIPQSEYRHKVSRSADVSPRLARTVSGQTQTVSNMIKPTIQSKQPVSRSADASTQGKVQHPDTPRPKHPVVNSLDVNLSRPPTIHKPTKKDNTSRLSRSATQQFNKQGVPRSSSVSRSATQKSIKQGTTRSSSATPQRQLSRSTFPSESKKALSSSATVSKLDKVVPKTAKPQPDATLSKSDNTATTNAILVEKTGELNMAFIMEKLKQSNNRKVSNKKG